MFVTSVLWTAFFIVNFNIAMMIPLLPFIQRDIGLTPSQSGLVLAAFPVSALVGNLAVGPFIDRLGRKRFIVAGAAACAVAFLFTAASGSAALIVLGRAATGLFMPMVGASVFAAIADYLPPADRGRVAGYVTTAAPIAFLFSMSLGVLLGGLLAWQLPVLAMVAIALALSASALALPSTPPEALAREPVTARTYRERLLSLSLDTGTRLLLLSYLCWSGAVFVFLGLYPSWMVQNGFPGHGAGTIAMMLLAGEIGGLFGAFFAGRLSAMFRHPLRLCAWAAIVAATVVLVIPAGTGLLAVQGLAYGVFAFCRDLMLALILSGAMLLVGAAQRGSLNALMNVIYQTGASLAGLVGAWLYASDGTFTANTTTACALFSAAALMLWGITSRKRPASA